MTGWYAAIVKGTCPDTLYELKDDSSWNIALNVGKVIMILFSVTFLFIGAQIVWRRHVRREMCPEKTDELKDDETTGRNMP